MKLQDLGPFAAPVALLIIFGVGWFYGFMFGFVWRSHYDAWGKRVGQRIARWISPPPPASSERP